MLIGRRPLKSLSWGSRHHYPMKVGGACACWHEKQADFSSRRFLRINFSLG